MLEHFFLEPSDLSYGLMHGHLDLAMVACSVLIAVFASFCALETMARQFHGRRRIWLLAGALMLGGGVWAMHFIGMLAFRLEVPVGYDPWLTLLSLVPGIVAAGAALRTLAGSGDSATGKILGGAILAAGIGVMHFTGMAAVRLDGALRYDRSLFVASLLVAVLLAITAMLLKPWLSRQRRAGSRANWLPSLLGGVCLGGAISGMHYVAMAAANFVRRPAQTLAESAVTVDSAGMAIGVAVVVTLLIVGGATVTFLIGRITSERCRIQAILASTSQGLLMLDRAGVVTGTNPAMLSMLGLTDPEVVGRSFRDWIASGDADVLRGGYRGEVGLRRADGSILPCLAYGNDVVDERGGLWYRFVLFSDISERKRHEADIRANQQRLLDILDFSPIAVRIATRQGREVVFYNQRYGEVIDNVDATGDDPGRYYTRPEEYREILAELAEGRCVMDRQVEIRTRNGRTLWMLASYMPIVYRDEEAVLGWFYDITERIEAQCQLTRQLQVQRDIEESLRIANAEQRAIFDSASSGIALLRVEIVLRCNRQLESIFGYSPGELDGRSTHLWYADDESDRIGGEAADRDILNGGSYRREQQLLRRDGSLFWARVTARALDGVDPANGVVALVDDIGIEREAAEALRKAKELAEDGAKMKADFLANMSHEIRTPMNAIIGLSHLALKTELSSQQRDYLQRIQASSHHLLGIINDILDFSKIEAGKLAVENIEFDLERMLDTVTGLVRGKADEKGLELICDVAEDVPMVLIGDPLRLGQVLINFGSNAVKFTEHGEVSVVIRKDRDSGREVKLRFAVRDTGIGLSGEQIHALFQPFRQGDSSTTRKYGGTGLGLAICKKLIELMGGEVGVDSEPGRGAEFWFTVWLGKGKERSKPLARPDLRGKRLLVVDDNENARSVLVSLLTGMLFSADQADSAETAVAAIREAIKVDRPYELIFVDWQMPKTDGIALAGNILGMGLTPRPKLILVTAYDRQEVLAGASVAGIDEVLIKPVNASSLFDSVIRALAGGPAPQLVSESMPLPTADCAGRLLLVEDNEMNQQIARELLQSWGYRVDVAGDGAEALTKLRGDSYDAVLMDMQMPIMNGVEATREIRKIPELVDLPVLAMTANAMSQDRDECLAAGMNDHIAKPIEPDDLLALLQRWLVRPPRRPPEPTARSPVPENVPGLDSAAGLRRMLGETDFYLAMLKKFVEGQADAAEAIGAALTGGDRETARRRAHTLKGLAGNIGALPVAELAEQLESRLRGGEALDAFAPLLAAIGDQLQVLSAGLQPWLPEEAAVEAPPPAAGEFQTALNRLKALLGDDDAESGDYLAANAQLFAGAFPRRYAELRKAVDNFEFAKALALLNETDAETE
ncbi:response regulator [Methylomonas sp. CM2]|uniref:response regulator n=1 Tax=Methylomonas sp. CM2 TaxID=3417647 RepID=UPI003CF5EFFD